MTIAGKDGDDAKIYTCDGLALLDTLFGNVVVPEAVFTLFCNWLVKHPPAIKFYEPIYFEL